MDINMKEMCSNEVRKVGLLLTKVAELGWDLGGYGEASVNSGSGNVYVWLEDYPVTPYIGLGGEDEICYSATCGECGHEWDISEARVKAERYPKRCPECKKAV